MSDTMNWGEMHDEYGQGTEPLPEGGYNFVIVKSEHKVAQSGKDMFVVQCKVEDGEHKGSVVFNNFVVSKESAVAMRIFFEHMAALGLTKQFWSTNPSMETVAKTLDGRRFYGTVKMREYQGVDRPDLKGVKPPRTGTNTAGAGGAAAPPPPPPAAAAAAPAPAPQAAPPPPAPAPAQEAAPPPPPAAPAPAPQDPPANIPPPPPVDGSNPPF